ncbi:hypothetical protein B0T24DRAFT_725269 [Lasiosphaeria ovina]|uniref:Uncharacterized protein n=1 Tax=Lasiosphaeria ovina TaxID=92902 RepID=A0AAE0MYD4_9PEZI|nr:hypothetical protein B0T24DRAFT_725269 [Lasiosphaeria ovina]
MDGQALPEPDVMAAAFTTLSTQAQRFANIAPIQDQQNIFATINALGQRIDQRIDTLGHAGILLPLVDIRDGGVIHGFPVSQPQLHAINDAAANIILAALDLILPPNTPLNIKRETILPSVAAASPRPHERLPHQSSVAANFDDRFQNAIAVRPQRADR